MLMDAPPKELRIEFRILEEALERVGPMSKDNDRLTYHLLTILKDMGLPSEWEYPDPMDDEEE